MLLLTRLSQILKYGWLHAKTISQKDDCGNTSIHIFCDIIYCYFKYGLWSNQYLNTSFYKLNKKERKLIGEDYKRQNSYKEKWVQGYFKEQKFLSKYADIKYDSSLSKRKKKIKAYSKQYNFGKNAYIEYNVYITKQHYSDSKMSAGDNFFVTHNVDIDYTGNIIIGANVTLTEGVKILTHAHDPYKFIDDDKLLPFSNRAYKTSLIIEDNVEILSHAIILPTVSRIGRNSIISAGAVVSKNVPENSVVAGNPAKVVATLSEELLIH